MFPLVDKPIQETQSPLRKDGLVVSGIDPPGNGQVVLTARDGFCLLNLERAVGVRYLVADFWVVVHAFLSNRFIREQFLLS